MEIEILNPQLAFQRLSDDDDPDAGVPVDIDDEDLEDEDGDDDEAPEEDAKIGPEDPYKKEEEEITE